MRIPSNRTHRPPPDLEDLAPEIVQRCHRSLDDIEANPFFDRVETVRDLVPFIDRHPPPRPAAA